MGTMKIPLIPTRRQSSVSDWDKRSDPIRGVISKKVMGTMKIPLIPQHSAETVTVN